MSILNIKTSKTQYTRRDGQIITGGNNTIITGGSVGGSVDTSIFVKLTGDTAGQTIVNDLIVIGSIYARDDMVAFSDHPAIFTGSTQYVLPIASASVLGGVKIGSNLTIDSNGVLSANAIGVSSWNDLTDKPATFTPSTHSHDYLPLGGGTLSGNVTAPHLNLTSSGGQLKLSGANITGGLWCSGNMLYLADWNTGNYGINIDMSNGNTRIGSNTVWHSGNFTPSNYSLTTHNHSTLYGNLTEVRADVNNPYVDLRFHSPNNDWARIRLEGGSFNFVSGGDSNWRDIKAGSIYSSSWFRNSNSGTGLYNEANATGIYSDAYQQMRIYNSGKFFVDNYTQVFVNQSASSAYPAMRISKLAQPTPAIPYDVLIVESNDVPTIRLMDADSGVGTISAGDGKYVFATNTSYIKFYVNGSGDGYGYAGLYGSNVFNIVSSGIGVNGDIIASGDITAFSDARLKTDLHPITNALDKIQNIQGYYYNRIDTQDNKQHLGLIAQEVQKQFPELVNQNNDTLSLNYQNYVAVLNEAIKELTDKVKELERRVK